ncbi:hypothetical protein SCLCIDRAFT_1211864 [Scleroderma citrinum Foug A]|uniref:Uncharacterized protein n=1 Tax=Scleroderma citrinum Foug A TaxID=1036808 RepID=A0A0C3ED62_9AGAM|nr:hypothetical protein SCLCIDRAFT_1211864 [Scleroderma citrinum Foug A]
MPVQPTSASGVFVTVIQAINGCCSISRRCQSDSAQLGGARDILQVTRSGSIASYGIIFNERLASYNPWLRIDRTSSRRTTVGPKTDREVFLDFTRLALPWRTAPSRASPPGRHRPLGRGRRRALATHRAHVCPRNSEFGRERYLPLKDSRDRYLNIEAPDLEVQECLPNIRSGH